MILPVALIWFARLDQWLPITILRGFSHCIRRSRDMPMRGNLPVRNLHLNDVGKAKNMDQVIKRLIGSPDLEVLIEFAAIGLLLSLCLAMQFPAFDDAIALFAQFP